LVRFCVRLNGERRGWRCRGRTLGVGAIAGSQGRYQLAIPTDAALFRRALLAAAPDGRVETLERALATFPER
jgi:hypothetical protein